MFLGEYLPRESFLGETDLPLLKELEELTLAQRVLQTFGYGGVSNYGRMRAPDLSLGQISARRFSRVAAPYSIQSL